MKDIEKAMHKPKLTGDNSPVEKKPEVMNMMQQALAPHESMEIHELLNFKTISLFKSKMMQGLVFDKDLKALMQKDVDQSMKAVTDLQSLYTRAPFH